MMPTTIKPNNNYIFDKKYLNQATAGSANLRYLLKDYLPNFSSSKIISFSVSVTVNNIQGVNKPGSQIFRITTNDFNQDQNKSNPAGEKLPAFFVDNTDPTNRNALTCIYSNNTSPNFFGTTGFNIVDSKILLQGTIDYNTSQINYYLTYISSNNLPGSTLPITFPTQISDLKDVSNSVDSLKLEIIDNGNSGNNGGIFLNSFTIYDYKYIFYNDIQVG